MSDILKEYKPLQTWMIWILIVFIFYIFLKRYELFILPTGDSFLAGIFSRFWENYLYGIIGAAFLGSVGYALCLFIVLVKSKHFLRLIALRLTGLPKQTTLDDITFLHNGGYELAVSPLHNAAALFPGLGFLGTVIGISLSIDGLTSVIAGQNPNELIAGLRTAFDTTFLGLVAALVLTLINMLLTQTVIKKRNVTKPSSMS